MKIGTYFGSFDPPHLGHLILPSYALKEFNLDKIIFVPSYKSVNKDNHFCSSLDRLNMLKLLIKNNPLFSIETYELEKQSQVYTFETLLYIKEKYKVDKKNLYLCIGSDWISNLDSWKNFEIIKENANFIIFIRRKNEVLSNGENYKNFKDESYKNILDFIDFKMKGYNIDKDSYYILTRQIDISSSEIRNLIKENEDFSYLLSESVYKYIIEKGLYQ